MNVNSVRNYHSIFKLIWEGAKGSNLAPVDDEVVDHTDPVSPVSPEPPQEPETVENYGPATQLIKTLKRLGHEVFEKDEKPYNLNIVGVRNMSAKLDQFACSINVFWKFKGEWKLLTWTATTYPGKRYLVEKLLNIRGAAILSPGQYKGIYKLDLHGGRYRALCQRGGTVKVFRDGDRDHEFDMEPSTLHEGMFGINVHAPITVRAGVKNYVASKVYAASAGCQVFQSVADFLEFRALCEKSEDAFGQWTTYTLIESTDLKAVDKPAFKDREKQINDPITFDSIEEWKPEGNTVGIRNKNLLNVKGKKGLWKYSEGVDKRGHHIFPGYAKGLRAGIITLRSYWTRHKRRTIAEILSRWAPATDTIGSLPGAPRNSPRDYSLYVASSMDHKPNAPLSLFNDDGSINDREQLYQIVSAMATYENVPRLDLPRDVFETALKLL